MEKCFDINHGTVPRGKTYQVGGPFFLVRVTEPTGVAGEGHVFPYSSASEPPGYPIKRVSDDLWQQGYIGSFIHAGLPSLVAIGNKDIFGPTDYRSQINPNDLSSLGARGWNKLRPKVEVAGLGTAIAEARDTVPMLETSAKGFHLAWKALGGSQHVPVWRNLKGTVATQLKQVSQYPKAAADQFLNVQFGWKPFVKDVSDMYDLIANYESHLDKAERHNDKWLKRRFAEEEVLEETQVWNVTRNKGDVIFQTYLNPGVSGPCTSSNLTVTRQKMTRIWYEGEFKYYRPELDKRMPMHENIRAGRTFLTLAGANINPTLIYKATPWTWCLDWFVNVGDNVQLAQDIATNAVAAKYMYLMRETFDRYKYVSTHVLPSGTITCTSYQEVRVKRRVGTEMPFSFSLLPGSLNGTQLAILGALGISKWH